MFIAQVIVDVPTMQTDQPYSYLIPENLSDVVSVGMRVEVPFGNGNRHIQGFVLAIEQVHPEKMTQDKIELKPLIRCLDLQPVLNEELLQLADYMKETTFAFKITCLQTMLPALLKASYDKQFRLLNPKAKVASYFQESAVLSFAEAEEKQLLAELKKRSKQKKCD